MEYIAEIIVNVPSRNISKAFSYYIPDELSYIKVGWRVLVPFGSQVVEGFVISINKNDQNTSLKSILSVIDDSEWFDDNMLKTAEWISSYYLCTLAEALRLFIPGKKGIKSHSIYRVNDSFDPNLINVLLEPKLEIHSKVFEHLRTYGAQSLSQLEAKFKTETLKTLQYLTKQKLVIREAITQTTRQAKYETHIKLAISLEEAKELQAKLKGKPAQKRLLSALLTKDKLSRDELKSIGVTSDTVKRLVNDGIACTVRTQVFRDSYAGTRCKSPALLPTPEQCYCLEHLNAAVAAQKYHSFLLHGITGSGKTQVYIESVAAVRKQNRQAIILVPEIALTSQIVSRFKASFADDVVVMHSKLSVAERSDAWQRLRTKQAGIVIGARSALFAPLPDIGIIIVDEEHEFTYKQEETPRYHACQVADIRARIADGIVLYGSATPSIETYYNALQGSPTLLKMLSRIDGASLPEVNVVDMREELRLGRRSIISLPLRKLLSETISRGEQAIILLNRRGYSTFVLCRECGHVLQCEHCSTSLVYHASGKALRCHYCQTATDTPDICPACGSRYIKYFGTGTQKLEEELTKLWPSLRVIRMDQDTTGKKMAHSNIIDAFTQGKYDILLGTQMVAKGHDIKNVTAVGIITADSTLNLPDFRAAERTFSLLTQAAGRAGRGDKQGKVIIQTYNPENYAILAGSRHDYTAFFQKELEYRKELFYPPYSKIIKLTINSNSDKDARHHAEELAGELRSLLRNEPSTEIVGPFNAAIYRVKDIFRVNIIIKAQMLDNIKAYIRKSGINQRQNIIIDVEPINVM